MTNETTTNFTIEVSENHFPHVYRSMSKERIETYCKSVCQREHWEFTKQNCSCVLSQLEMELNHN